MQLLHGYITSLEETQIDHEMGLQVVREWLPGIDLESMINRALTQSLADHFVLPFESINEHAGVIRELEHILFERPGLGCISYFGRLHNLKKFEGRAFAEIEEK